VQDTLAAWEAVAGPMPRDEVGSGEVPARQALQHRAGRAALEAALIDLALRQAGSSLASLTGVAEAPLRVVMSFAACADPVAVIRLRRASGYRGEFKVDVDPSWDQATRQALARQGGVAILDFKGRGTAADAVALAGLFAGAIFEDPPPGTVPVPVRISRDATLGDAAAVGTAVAAGEAVNLKAPRMGGPLELLRGLEQALRARAMAYFGGMFEVSVGRLQARQLAALFCGDAPNDLAPNLERSHLEERPPRPSSVVVRLDSPGFGARA
jgi:L-alanine-DL-glutamate epimerase-like enolase superfamily enzyme